MNIEKQADSFLPLQLNTGAHFSPLRLFDGRGLRIPNKTVVRDLVPIWFG